jgi:hypothetical protein
MKVIYEELEIVENFEIPHHLIFVWNVFNDLCASGIQNLTYTEIDSYCRWTGIELDSTERENLMKLINTGKSAIGGH